MDRIIYSIFLQECKDVIVIENNDSEIGNEQHGEDLPTIGANVEVADDNIVTEEGIELYQWRCLREEQDKEYEEALLVDQAKVNVGL